jgi:hypothetical protein
MLQQCWRFAAANRPANGKQGCSSQIHIQIQKEED